LLHALNKKSWSAARDLGVLNWAQQAISDGRVGHLGFSFHDELAVFKEIIDATDQWTFCQIQYNFMDVDYQAGSQGLKYAASKGLAVVIMEPLRGGQLARKIPQGVAKLWSMAQHKRTAVDWALQWVWNQPEVSLLLSGMSTMQQVEENVASANCSCPGVLSEEELALIDQVHAAYSGLSPIPCTNCKYCLPCPSGVNIPRILELYNSAIMFEDSQESRDDYQFLKEDERADRCSECLQCEELCPQSIAIPDWLKKANTLLSAAE